MGFWKKDYQPKYIAKVPLKKVFGKQTYRYFYTMSAYRAYLKSKETNVASTAPVKTNNTKTEKTNVIDKITKAMSDIGNKTVKEISETVEKGKTAVEQVRSKTIKQVSEYVEKGKAAVDKANNDSAVEMFKKAINIDGGNRFVPTSSKIEPNLPDEITTSGVSYDEIVKKYPKIATILPKKWNNTTPEEDMKNVNPYYQSTSDFHTNCYSCSMAYDLTKRGFDAVAITDIYDGLYDWDIASCYDNGKMKGFNLISCKTTTDAANAMEAQLLKNSNDEDSYGFITVTWKNGGGHIFNYEISNGEVKYVDSQINEVVDIEEYLSYINYRLSLPIVGSTVNFMRTDNLCPNENILYATTSRDLYDLANAPSESGNINKDAHNKVISDYKQIYDLLEDVAKETRVIYNDKLETKVFGDSITTGELKKWLEEYKQKYRQ